MTLEANKKLVSDFFEAGNRGDFDACFALIADDIVWTNSGSTRFSGRFSGKQTVMNDLIGPLFGRLKNGIHAEIVKLVAEGDIVVAETRGRAETTDGKPYNNSYCHIVRLRDGQWAEVTEFLDTALVDETFGPA